MLRREFLKLSGVFIASAALPGSLTGCFHNSSNIKIDSFSLGVASGDPRPESVVIWTRAVPSDGSRRSHNVIAEVALEEDFTTLVLQETYAVSNSSDYTINVIVENLQPNTFYYYRFINDIGEASITGRTLTAPAENNSDAFRYAFVSCQDYSHGFYKAYRQMINDDIAAADENKIRFVLHLGDFIYETRFDPLQLPVDESLRPISGGLIDKDGEERRIPSFPQGGITSTGIEFANTRSDYRHLYRQYLSDPDLQAARARWPFIHIWDDHEFTDDCWQSEANYNDIGKDSSTNEPSQQRKVAANQAWFEYMPVNLLQINDVEEDLRHAKEFQFQNVENTPNEVVNDDNQADNEDNIKAIESMTIYRSFRFGQLFDLFVTDNRSYRSDHAVPEDFSGNLPVFLHPRMVMPLDLVNELDAGRTAFNNDPDTFVIAGGLALNPRVNSPAGTMLGKRQKQWWKDNLQRSTARWKFWGNPVPLMRFLINLSALETGVPDVVMSSDSWDGYATERNELMKFLTTNNINNVVSLSGDLHAHFAGTVMDNFDAEAVDNSATAVFSELVCGSVSSISMFAAIHQLAQRDEPSELERTLQSLISYKGQPDISSDEVIVNNLNNTLMNGVLAGIDAAQTRAVDGASINAGSTVNSHLKYADTDGHGYGLIDVETNQVIATLVTIDSINIDSGSDSPGIKRLARFVVPHTEAGDTPTISDAVITGTPPFPF